MRGFAKQAAGPRSSALRSKACGAKLRVSREDSRAADQDEIAGLPNQGPGIFLAWARLSCVPWPRSASDPLDTAASRQACFLIVGHKIAYHFVGDEMRLDEMRLMVGAKPVAGLVIRPGAVELLAMEGRRVAVSVRVPIEGDGPEPLSRAVQQALAQGRLKTKRLAVAVEHPGVLFRSFTLALLPKTEWEAAIPFEARRYLPFKTESLVWDYHAIQHPEAKQMEVVFAAMPRDAFQVVQEALAAAGLQPSVIEPRSVSLARLAQAIPGAAPDEPVCLVDVEQEAAHLAIVKHGVPYLSRDISLLPKAAPAAAEGAPEPGADGPGEPADQRVQRLLSELSVSIDFFIREYPSTTISRILLFGERQLVEPWCGWLAGKLSCPVEPGSGLVGTRIEGSLELSFASALGLLARAEHGREPAVDFLKRSLTKVPQGERVSLVQLVQSMSMARLTATLRTPQAAMCAAALVGLLGVAWLLGSLRVQSVRRQVSQLIAARPDVGWGLRQMTQEALAPVKEAATSQLTFLAQVMDHRVSAAAKLDVLARSLPEGMWLNGLTFQDPIDGASGTSRPRLIIQGACLLGERGKELETIQQFEELVKRDPVLFSGFSVTQLEYINTKADPVSNQYTYHTFQLNCDANRKL